MFKFPESSFIAANSELIISSDISGLKFSDNNFRREYCILTAPSHFLIRQSPLLHLPKPKEIILSKPPEKKAEIAVGPVISKKNFQI